MRRHHTWATVGLLAVLGACAGSDDAVTMDQEQARTRLAEVVDEVLRAAAPDHPDRLDHLTDAPCGGLNGTEWRKVQYTLDTLVDGRVADDEAAVEAALARVEERGWEGVRRDEGISFTADGVHGSLTARDGQVHVLAETDCIDNEER